MSNENLDQVLAMWEDSVEKARAIGRPVAQTYWTMFKAFIDEGFARDEALTLTRDFMAGNYSSVPEEPEEEELLEE